MWIVRLALRRPYTFVVMALLIAILGTSAIVSMPVDIFPYIDIPVVSVVWNYNGLSPEEMEKRLVTIFERSMTTTVNDIEHIESQCYTGVSVTRVYFQPAAKVELALAQITAISQTLLRIFPPGTTPPSVVKYDASSVPILQLGLGSQTMSEQELFDMGQNFIRTQLATIQGAAIPLPYGGKFRSVMVDLNPEQLFAKLPAKPGTRSRISPSVSPPNRRSSSFVTTDITPGASDSFSENLDAVVTFMLRSDSRSSANGSFALPPAFWDCGGASPAKEGAEVRHATKRGGSKSRRLDFMDAFRACLETALSIT